MTPGTAVFPMPPAVCARKSLRWFASLRARVVCARAARFEIFARVRAWRSRLTPSRGFPAVGKSAPLQCFPQNGGGAFRGGDPRRCQARPRSVSFPVARS